MGLGGRGRRGGRRAGHDRARRRQRIRRRPTGRTTAQTTSRVSNTRNLVTFLFTFVGFGCVIGGGFLLVKWDDSTSLVWGSILMGVGVISLIALFIQTYKHCRTVNETVINRQPELSSDGIAMQRSIHAVDPNNVPFPAIERTSTEQTHTVSAITSTEINSNASQTSGITAPSIFIDAHINLTNDPPPPSYNDVVSSAKSSNPQSEKSS